jgi:RNA polymerase sigma-70 factor (ECF subfamily)
LTHQDEFTAHRALLFSIAYEILGSVADAEDALQDSYLRWRDVNPSTVENKRSYIAQIVTRQALQMLRSASRKREEYIGPWLPEPLATSTAATSGPEHVLTGEAVSTAMLLVLESLTPDQRAVFVLREVFDFEYGEIAAAVGKSQAAVRQINHRARNHVRARRDVAITTPVDAQPALERCLAAVTSGDIQGLMDALAPDVVAIVDGGGVVNAARRPVRGRAKVARLMLALLRVWERMGLVSFRFGVYNGAPALLVLIEGKLDSLTCIEVHDGLITAAYGVRNPSKLAGVKL